MRATARAASGRRLGESSIHNVCGGPVCARQGVGSLEGLIVRLSRNERLLEELEKCAVRLGRACEYLGRPNCHRALAHANFAHRLACYASALASLRANQAEAHRHLGRSPDSTHAEFQSK
jgi:hypothetical protein